MIRSGALLNTSITLAEYDCAASCTATRLKVTTSATICSLALNQGAEHVSGATHVSVQEAKIRENDVQDYDHPGAKAEIKRQAPRPEGFSWHLHDEINDCYEAYKDI